MATEIYHKPFLYWPRGLLLEDPVLKSWSDTFVCNFTLKYITFKGTVTVRFAAWGEIGQAIANNYRAGDRIRIAKAVLRMDHYKCHGCGKEMPVPAFNVIELDMEYRSNDRQGRQTDLELQEGQSVLHPLPTIEDEDTTELPFDWEGLDDIEI